MGLRKEEDQQTMDYFVRQKLKSGSKFVDTELWAKEWLDQYAASHKNSEELYYKAYHNIPKYVEVWEEKLNIKDSTINKNTRKIYDFTHKEKARRLIEQNRYKTKINFNELQPEEYKMICDWLEGKSELPTYLRGILEYIPTFTERFEHFIGKSVEQFQIDLQNKLFYVFIIYFFMIVMIINL
ncbi:hypothetical protein [Bacillus sp. Brlt_9]|uniref:hypothetical protein n=1 Tax=Bacillus sp. Brlt_9 TaxID=3110916 RepID=UPI003F7C7E31